jgi:hypothetical protein
VHTRFDPWNGYAREIVVEIRREQPDRVVPVGEQVEGAPALGDRLSATELVDARRSDFPDWMTAFLPRPGPATADSQEGAGPPAARRFGLGDR